MNPSGDIAGEGAAAAQEAAPGATGAPSDALHELRDAMRQFAAERAWEPFHTPKNLAMALAGEAGEVIEHFQWLTAEQSMALPPAAVTEPGTSSTLSGTMPVMVRSLRSSLRLPA